MGFRQRYSHAAVDGERTAEAAFSGSLPLALRVLWMSQIHV